MSDLIERQAAIDALDRIFDRCEEIEVHLPEGDPDRTGYRMYPDYMTVRMYLNMLPSAQPEIIRCKDCKHYYYADNRVPQEQRYVCDLDSDRWKPDDYCSYAERRTDE